MRLGELVAIPAHPPFFLGSTPVTNGSYAAFVEAGRVAAPPWWSDPDFHSPNQPVVGVTWDDAMAYCSWLGESKGGIWRLPTEAELELAASGVRTSQRLVWGDGYGQAETTVGEPR